MQKDNIAYIDGANLYKGTKELDWYFNYGRFHIWLSERYGVGQVYLFIGMMPKHKDMYDRLTRYGYKLIFKDVTYDTNGKPKGNCDADLIVRAMIDVYENKCARVIIVSSDGDFTPLIKFLIEKDKMDSILSPYDASKCSILLKRTGAKVMYISDQRKALESQNKKAPGKDGTLQGSFS